MQPFFKGTDILVLPESGTMLSNQNIHSPCLPSFHLFTARPALTIPSTVVLQSMPANTCCST